VKHGIGKSLAASCSAEGHVRLSDGPAAGQGARVLRGPFADMIGKLARLDAGGRVQVLLRLFCGARFRIALARDADAGVGSVILQRSAVAYADFTDPDFARKKFGAR
jgi:hypothetical protein